MELLKHIDWDSHTCACKVEVRQYLIERDPLVCHLHRIDGSIEPVPMYWTTISEMASQELNRDYWLESQIRQRRNIAVLDKEILAQHRGSRPSPNVIELFGVNDISGLEAVRENVAIGRTSVDDKCIRRSPGSQLRGHLSHRCPQHGNRTTTSLQSQIATYSCGCQIRQITMGERREDGLAHEQVVIRCLYHSGVRAARG